MTTDLATRLETRAAAPARSGATVFDLIERQKPQIALALPDHIDTDRFTRIAVTELRRNPRLQACNPTSLLGALMQSAQLGLEPGPLGEAYLVPFKDEITFIVGYRGLMKLIHQSDEVASLVAREVYEGDEFAFWSDEDGDHFKHVPNLKGDRGAVYAYYGVARFRDGGQLVHVMTQADVDRHRKRSRSADNGPWRTDPIAMGLKTVIRAMSRWLPMSTEVASAIESDDRAYQWDGRLVVDDRDRVDEDDTWYEDEAKRRAELPAPSRYDTWTKQQLVDVCVERGLTTSGTKADLAARLIEHDAAAPAAVEIVEGSTAASSTGGEPVLGVDAGSPPGSPDGGEPTEAGTARSASEPGDGVDAPAGMSAAASPPSDGSARSDFGEPLPPGPDTVSDDPAFWSTERWAAEVDRRGVNRNTVLRLARQLAEQAGIEPLPSEFGDWTAPAITVPLGEWLVTQGDAA